MWEPSEDVNDGAYLDNRPSERSERSERVVIPETGRIVAEEDEPGKFMTLFGVGGGYCPKSIMLLGERIPEEDVKEASLRREFPGFDEDARESV
jgi:hypothetical protein